MHFCGLPRAKRYTDYRTHRDTVGRERVGKREREVGEKGKRRVGWGGKGRGDASNVFRAC